MAIGTAGIVTFVKLVLAARLIATGEGVADQAKAFTALLDNASKLNALIHKSGLDPLAERIAEAARNADQAFAREPALTEARVLFDQVRVHAIPAPDLVAGEGLKAPPVVAQMEKNIDRSELGRDFDASPLARRYFRAVATAALGALFDDPDYTAKITPHLWRQALSDLGEIKKGQAEIKSLLIEALKGIGQPARQSGVTEKALVELARRISVTVSDADSALRELQRAVDINVRVQSEGRLGSNLGDFTDEVLRRTAALAAEGAYDEAAAAIDVALAQEEAEMKARQIRLLDAGLEQDILRGNAESAAERLARKTELGLGPGDSLFDALLAVQDEWYGRGRDKGLNFELKVAVVLAGLANLRAGTADQRGAALNNRGNALTTLGEREPGTARLEEAVSAFRLALEERTRERVPLTWAMTQMNLGNALQALGWRETGTEKLEQAVVAYRLALEERTRDKVPMDWAMTQMNLGNALQALGGRENDTARLKEAVVAYRLALEERTRDKVATDWAMTQMNLGNALQTLGGRENDTARLKEAVIAYRLALEVKTQRSVPLDWAMIQMNLGNALTKLGSLEHTTAHLEEAAVAYRLADTERTRDRVPIDYGMTHFNWALLDLALHDETGDPAHLDAAEAHVASAREVFVEAAAAHYLVQTDGLAYDIARRRNK